MKVKKHIAINLKGVKEGDFTFVMGFPGRNWRYMISDEVEERMQTTNFMRDTIRGVRLRVLGEEMAKDARTVSSMQPSMLHRPTTGKMPSV